MADKILFLDPSSTRIGWAVFAGGKMLEAGLITPARERDEPNVRIATMTQDVMDLAREHGIRRIVLEDTSGKVSKRHKGGGAGLAIYGKAVGWYIGALTAKGFTVETVLENGWTSGGSKATRQRSVAARHKSYRPDIDKGMDLSDAIALGEWYLTRKGLPC